MKILGIETSCDETAAAVIENGDTIINNVKATSIDVHIKYGGIVPDKAARETLKSILPIIHEALDKTPISEIDAIAVTYGPGLIGSLLVGVETAKTPAFVWNKPLIPVNHLLGHIYANWLTKNKSTQNYNLPTIPPTLPALILLVSGGHSEIVLMDENHNFTQISTKRDDAAGECFDKCGRLLGLPYPYGPFIEELAKKYNQEQYEENERITLPRPLNSKDEFDFSFSGLKTAFLQKVQRQEKTKEGVTEKFKIALAHELQEAVTDSLTKKYINAANLYQPKSLIVAGGVAANTRLREKIKQAMEKNNLTQKLFIPDIKLCTDNAAYIATAAFYQKNISTPFTLNADPSLDINPSA
jgi:N6-L-threonylcarbamoyladenine synthase